MVSWASVDAHSGYRLIRWYLRQYSAQHWCVAHTVVCHLNGSYRQCGHQCPGVPCATVAFIGQRALAGAYHCTSVSSQIVSDPRALSAALSSVKRGGACCGSWAAGAHSRGDASSSRNGVCVTKPPIYKYSAHVSAKCFHKRKSPEPPSFQGRCWGIRAIWLKRSRRQQYCSRRFCVGLGVFRASRR